MHSNCFPLFLFWGFWPLGSLRILLTFVEMSSNVCVKLKVRVRVRFQWGMCVCRDGCVCVSLASKVLTQISCFGLASPANSKLAAQRLIHCPANIHWPLKRGRVPHTHLCFCLRNVCRCVSPCQTSGAWLYPAHFAKINNLTHTQILTTEVQNKQLCTQCADVIYQAWMEMYLCGKC